MNEKSLKNERIIRVILVLLSFVLMGLFFYFVPYNNDDYTWGGDLGLTYLKNGFADYNGRYLGNIFTIIITRSVILKILLMSLVTTALCYSASRLAGKKTLNYPSFFFLLFALIFTGKVAVIAIFPQTLTWVAGFTNYVTPTMIIVTYLMLVRNIFEEEPPEYKKYLWVAGFLLGLSGALFVEHVALFNIGISALIIIYSYLRFKRKYAVQLSFFAGAVTGAVIMFTNSSYQLIARGEFGEKNMRKIGFFDSFKKALSLGIYLLKDITHGKKALILAIVAFMIIGLIILLALPFFITKNKAQRAKLLLPLICMAGLTLPLLFANSGTVSYLFAPRCYFPHYVFLAIYALQVFDIIYEKLGKKLRSSIAVLLAVAICIVGCFYGFVYKDVHAADLARVSYIEKQKKDGANPLYIVLYPDNIAEYIYLCNDFSDEYKTKAKDFYGIDEETEIETISYNDYVKTK